MDTIQTCGNCKHFKVIKQSREVKKILDTSYIIARCEIKGWEVKEHYLLKTNNEITQDSIAPCKFWEHWKTKRACRQKRHKKQ